MAQYAWLLPYLLQLLLGIGLGTLFSYLKWVRKPAQITTSEQRVRNDQGPLTQQNLALINFHANVTQQVSELILLRYQLDSQVALLRMKQRLMDQLLRSGDLRRRLLPELGIALGLSQPPGQEPQQGQRPRQGLRPRRGQIQRQEQPQGEDINTQLRRIQRRHTAQLDLLQEFLPKFDARLHAIVAFMAEAPLFEALLNVLQLQDGQVIQSSDNPTESFARAFRWVNQAINTEVTDYARTLQRVGEHFPLGLLREQAIIQLTRASRALPAEWQQVILRLYSPAN